MRYIIFVIDQQSLSASGDEMSAIDAFNDALRANGHFILAIGIGGPSTAQLIDNRVESSAELAVAESLFTTDDFYSGLWLIHAETPEVAKQLALQASKACNRRVELRPLL